MPFDGRNLLDCARCFYRRFVLWTCAAFGAFCWAFSYRRGKGRRQNSPDKRNIAETGQPISHTTTQQTATRWKRRRQKYIFPGAGFLKNARLRFRHVEEPTEFRHNAAPCIRCGHLYIHTPTGHQHDTQHSISMRRRRRSKKSDMRNSEAEKSASGRPEKWPIENSSSCRWIDEWVCHLNRVVPPSRRCCFSVVCCLLLLLFCCSLLFFVRCCLSPFNMQSAQSSPPNTLEPF